MCTNFTCQARFIPILCISLGLVTQTSLPAGELPSDLPNGEFTISTGTPLVVTVPASSEARLRSVLISLKEPSRIPPGMSITASIKPITERPGTGSTMSKTLHLGDPT